PEGYTSEKSPNGAFTKEKDIMDVWFDSGSSWNGVLRERGTKYPSDLYLEGNDQYRGWFNASLILSLATQGVAPFHSCLTHGWVMDENWEKMSKSKGNGIDPSKVANQFGADLLRLWAATIDFTADVRISESILKVISETYRKIRNTFRFLLGNLQDGQGKPYEVPAKAPKLFAADRWILAELEEVKNKALKAYDSFDFPNVIGPITAFLAGDLSSFYLDVAKDSLYCDAANSPRRKAYQYVIYQVAHDLCLLLNPILSFTMDEVYQNLPGKKKSSPQLEDMPKASKEYGSEVLEEFALFKASKDIALKALEEARAQGMIGSNNGAKVCLSLQDEKAFTLLKGIDPEELETYFGVNSLSIRQGEDAAKVEKADGQPCARCRNLHEHLEESEHGLLCKRCVEVLKEIEE
ncbi:MAG: class I tRNA ligase family protein, partial [Bacilli bacterium]|nr:class I tRNA ligase family protein [Bacilli bacterium]